MKTWTMGVGKKALLVLVTAAALCCVLFSYHSRKVVSEAQHRIPELQRQVEDRRKELDHAGQPSSRSICASSAARGCSCSTWGVPAWSYDGRCDRVELDADAGRYTCDGPPHNFVDLVLGKTATNHAPGEAALRSVELLDAAYRSAASGQAEQI